MMAVMSLSLPLILVAAEIFEILPSTLGFNRQHPQLVPSLEYLNPSSFAAL